MNLATSFAKLFDRSVVLLFLLTTLHVMQLPVMAQTELPANPGKAMGGMIAGKVTIQGKGGSDITVALRADDGLDGESPMPPRTVTTDKEGNYQITNVAAGAYQIAPIAPSFVVANASSSIGSNVLNGRSLILAERETVRNVDFALTRGGVISGRVTDSEGRPLIEQPVNLIMVGDDGKTSLGQMLLPGPDTDDRGIYRAFGLPKGKYLVSVGRGQGGFFGGASRHSEYRQTFHPAVTDAAKATVIEVTEGSEATNVDITVSTNPTSDTFSISGRIVDGTTGEPLARVVLGLQTRNSSVSSRDWGSNQSGEFRFQNLLPGKYSIYVESQLNSEVRAEPLAVEIVDRDVTGVVMKTIRSASISGVLEFENSDARSNVGRLGQLELQTFVLTENQEGGRARSVSVKPDASFRVGGLPAGRAFFLIMSSDAKGFRIMRVERDGVVQQRGIEIKDGEVVTGVRLVTRVGSGSVRGIVKAEGADLASPPRLEVWLSVSGEEGINPFAATAQAQVDLRGHFLIEKVPPGDYEVNAAVFTPRGRVTTKQPVSVVDGSVTEVTLILNLKSDSNPELK